MRRLVVISIAVVAGLAGLGCRADEPDWPAAIDRYYPAALDGAPVESKYEFPTSLAESLAAPTMTTSIARSVGDPTGTDPLPDFVLLAFRGPKQAVDETRDDLYTELAGSGPGEIVRVDGVGVRSVEFRQGERAIALAEANPRPDVLLIALDFGGRRDEAERALRAMLTAAS